MSTIVTRAGKGSPLTHVEVDANFTNLDTDKVEKTAAAITGGTINGTTIGATTPSSVNATTITGQTGQLNGTGQNLFIYSEQFNNSAWTKTSVSITADSITAPNGTTTADTVTASAGASTHDIDPASGSFFGMTSGFSYVISVYAKKGTNNFFQICVLNQNTDFANFDLNNGTVGTTGGSVTASILSVGDGWYRCSLLITVTGTTRRPCLALVPSSSATRRESWTATGTETVYLWGAQLDLGSNLGVYTQTVATTVFNTTRVSFNGIATLGLESNGSLFVQPAGTGALQAQATTSTSAGGNARGTYAVDWQTIRSAASQVASGTYATLGGGINNTVGGFGAIIAGGGVNTASATYAAIGGGQSNNAGSYSYIGSGQSNTGSGLYNFIGGGFTNSGTSGSAVTTQSGTMNATTAVTLSGSNANIKVGQYISGTSIASDTYVAAISGTALTLSKVASGSSTSTLSFFTPHGVVVGGGNNQATGAYSAILGGGDAGTAANRNVASGDWSFVGGGQANQATGIGAFIGGGGVGVAGTTGNTAGGNASAILGGGNHSSSGLGSAVLGGYGNLSSGNYSSTLGFYASSRGIIGNFAQASGRISTGGDNQAAILVLKSATTDATATALTSNASAAGSTNQVILPNNSAYFFRGEVISGVTGGGNTKGWTIEGVIKRGANAASTALVGTPTVTSTYADAGASTWVIAVTADTTNGGLRVTFTGQAGTTIRTVCQIRTTEMTY